MIDLNEYTPPEYACRCGKTHTAYTRRIETGEGAMKKLPEVCKELVAQGRVGIACDENVRTIAEEAERLLVRAGYRTKLFCSAPGDAYGQSQTLSGASEDVRLWVAVGCGSVADAVRYVANARKNEWVLVLTAPTTDAVLYPYCEFVRNGTRETFPAAPPIAAIADYTVIENAPKFTIAAGYGTLLSKLVRTFDFYFDKLTDKRRCSYLTSEFEENLTDFFNTQSCESVSLRVCRTLLRLGIISQLADEIDFCQGSEYFSSLCLRSRCGNSRLTGENAAICSFLSYCVLDSYLAVSPEDLFIPSSLPEHIRFLDKQCGQNGITLLSHAKRNRGSEADLYVLKEYAPDLDAKLRELFGNAKGSARQFRRLYDDAGYWLGSYCTRDVALRTVCAASAAYGEGLLSSLVFAGALGQAV